MGVTFCLGMMDGCRNRTSGDNVINMMLKIINLFIFTMTVLPMYFTTMHDLPTSSPAPM